MRRRSFCAPLLLAGLCLHVQARADEVVTLLPLSLDELIATPVITASRRAEVMGDEINGGDILR